MNPAPPLPGSNICSYQYELRERESYTAEHMGIDLCADCGSPILAPMPGKVMAVYVTELGGNTLILKHSEKLYTRYAHCESIQVRVGQSVYRSQKIATVGSTGSAARGCHLHFAMTDVFYEPGTRIYREDDHYDVLSVLASIGIVDQGKTLVYKPGYPRSRGLGILGWTLIGVGAAGAYLIVSKLTGSKLLGAGAALPILPP